FNAEQTPGRAFSVTQRPAARKIFCERRHLEPPRDHFSVKVRVRLVVVRLPLAGTNETFDVSVTVRDFLNRLLPKAVSCSFAEILPAFEEWAVESPTSTGLGAFFLAVVTCAP